MIWTLLETTPNANGPTNQWILIALGGLTIVYIVFIRPNRKPKKPRDPLDQMRAGAGLAQQRSIERDMSNLLVEYEGMIRRMTAQLDTRAARLETLIADAEERIATLRALAAPQRGGPSVPSVPATPRALHKAPLLGEIVDDGSARGDGETPPVEAPPVEEHRPPEPADRRHQEVYDLADGGLTARQIAQRLSRPNGEVELILALRGSRG